MTTQTDSIKVTTHVSRNLEQNAAYFNTFEKIVWEYVSNALDAAQANVPAVVITTLQSNSITVKDNGIGMSREELGHFFQMHGENLHRRRRKQVRGQFGTGKSAAFGLAHSLTISTVHNGLRNVARLTRADIESAADGQPIPVQSVESDSPTLDRDGTTVVIEKFMNRKRPKVEKVTSYVERHLSRYRGRATVTINGVVCRFEEPRHRDLRSVSAPPHVQEQLGDIKLIVKIAAKPLEPERVGIDILSHGIWHATTSAGIENKDRSEYIFGEIDVAALEDRRWEPPPFDNTRSMQLNEGSPGVAMLLGWISEVLAQIREELVREERERRQTEQARRLEREAQRIARVLNEDFAQQELQLERARERKQAAQQALEYDEPSDAEALLPGDGELPTGLQEAGNPHGDGTRGDNAGEGDEPRPGPSLIEGAELGGPAKTRTKGKRRRRPIFSIVYENATPQEPRSRYDGAEKTIYINLDHLQIASALQASGGKTTGKPFREMCYEVAAVEYAMALEYERIGQGEVDLAEDALFNFRTSIDRVMNRIALILYG